LAASERKPAVECQENTDVLVFISCSGQMRVRDLEPGRGLEGGQAGCGTWVLGQSLV
jgi:hypothetical protein